MGLYEEKLASLNLEYQEIDIETKFGRTRIIKTGNPNGKELVFFHGINAGSPLTLEAVKELGEKYTLYMVDTIGQTTKSAETVLNMKDNSYAVWANELLEKLNLSNANIISISYGAFISQKLMIHYPNRIGKCIMVVPSGIVSSYILPSITKLSFPLIQFMITKKDKYLRKFTKAFVPDGDEFMLKMQRIMLLDVKMDYTKPFILKAKDIAHFEKPVYIITADNDIFFPNEKIQSTAPKIFKNLKNIYVLKNTKHMPHPTTFLEIQSKIIEWIEN